MILDVLGGSGIAPANAGCTCSCDCDGRSSEYYTGNIDGHAFIAYPAPQMDQ